MSADTTKMWGGRFSESTNEFVQRFTASVDFDKRLYAYDILGSKQHASMLAKVGVLTQDECNEITNGLAAIQLKLRKASFSGRKNSKMFT